MATKSKNYPVMPGKHKKTVFMMKGQEGFSFGIEQIDTDVYELTTATYDGTGGAATMGRTEYVLHCSKASLIDLKAAINHVVK